MPKTCLHEGCTTQPTYGKKGEPKKMLNIVLLINLKIMLL